MLNVKQIANNMIELHTTIECITGRTAEYYVLVSYETPVVVVSIVNHKQSVFINKKWFSQTTTKHINKYLTGNWGYNMNQIKAMPKVNKFSILDDTGKPVVLMRD